MEAVYLEEIATVRPHFKAIHRLGELPILVASLEELSLIL